MRKTGDIGRGWHNGRTNKIKRRNQNHPQTDVQILNIFILLCGNCENVHFLIMMGFPSPHWIWLWYIYKMYMECFLAMLSDVFFCNHVLLMVKAVKIGSRDLLSSSPIYLFFHSFHFLFKLAIAIYEPIARA